MSWKQDVKYIEQALEDWASWTAGHVEQSAIGYPSSTVEGRAKDGLVRSGQPAGSICPDVMMPPRIARIDRLLGHAPKKIRAIAQQHYVERDRRAGTWYWHRVDSLHVWVHGMLIGAESDRA